MRMTRFVLSIKEKNIEIVENREVVRFSCFRYPDLKNVSLSRFEKCFQEEIGQNKKNNE
jgi:hypothetical protein